MSLITIGATFPVGLWLNCDNVQRSTWASEERLGQDLDGDGRVGRPKRHTRLIPVSGGGKRHDPILMIDEEDLDDGEDHIIDGFDLEPADVAAFIQEAALRGLPKRNWLGTGTRRYRLPNGAKVTRGVWDRCTSELVRLGWAENRANGLEFTRTVNDMIEEIYELSSKAGRAGIQKNQTINTAARVIGGAVILVLLLSGCGDYWRGQGDAATQSAQAALQKAQAARDNAQAAIVAAEGQATLDKAQGLALGDAVEANSDLAEAALEAAIDAANTQAERLDLSRDPGRLGDANDRQRIRSGRLEGQHSRAGSEAKLGPPSDRPGAQGDLRDDGQWPEADRAVAGREPARVPAAGAPGSRSPSASRTGAVSWFRLDDSRSPPRVAAM